MAQSIIELFSTKWESIGAQTPIKKKKTENIFLEATWMISYTDIILTFNSKYNS